jgi:hypothetical protein
MIYIPIELQLQWIREDLEEIKKQLRPIDTIKEPADCPDCDFAISTGLSKTCTAHAPEFMMRIQSFFNS